MPDDVRHGRIPRGGHLGVAGRVGMQVVVHVGTLEIGVHVEKMDAPPLRLMGQNPALNIGIEVGGDRDIL